MNQQLLDIISCPQTHKPLNPVSERWLAALNRAVESGQLTTRAGAVVTKPLAGGFITADERIFYPLHDGIPVLLEGESILLAQLDGI
ncbi:MAG: Trm112 family protein [Pseudomonadota bacterium]